MRAHAMLARLAASGALTGAALTARDLYSQQYFGQGLWRTGLWLLSTRALFGLAAGLAAGLGFILALRLSERAGSETRQGAARRFLCFLGLMAGAAIILSPMRGGPPGAPSYLALIGVAYAVAWLLLSALGARYVRGVSDCHWFWARWMSIIVFGFIAAGLHVWVRSTSWRGLGQGLALSLVVTALLAALLRRPARSAHDRLGRPLGRVIASRPGSALAAVVLFATFGLAVTAIAERAGERDRSRARARNVILIGIDTLRLDRTTAPTQETEPDLCPQLRRLASRGTTFGEAYAQAPWTLPSFASIHTGLYPEQHGAEHLTSALAPERLTLAELLREAGYRTMGVVSCEYLNAASGLGQGFDILDESQVLGHQAVTSEAITDRGLRLLEEHHGEPFFLFLHYFDPHFCYQDHPGRHLADDYNGWLREAVEKAYALGPAFQSRARVSQTDIDFIRNAYDEEVFYTDSQIGRLLDYLDAKDLWDSTLVIAVSDHGEELLERNWSGHTVTLYQEQIHIPLILVAPGTQPGRSTSRPIEARAVFATVLDFLGLAVPDQPTAAVSLLREDLSRDPPLVRSATRPVAEAPGPGEFIPKYVWLTAITDGRWKLVKDHLHRRLQLFDLASDPRELSPCAVSYPEERDRLRSALDRLDAEVARTGPRRPSPVADEEQQRRLKSLGYL
jgi:arylsulfatase A-like enzyme